MRHDPEFHRFVAQGRYRPARQWLNYPGKGATIRRRPGSARRWRFRALQLRVLLLALVVAVIAWSQLG